MRARFGGRSRLPPLGWPFGPPPEWAPPPLRRWAGPGGVPLAALRSSPAPPPSQRRRPAGPARRAAWCTAPHPRPRRDPAGAAHAGKGGDDLGGVVDGRRSGSQSRPAAMRRGRGTFGRRTCEQAGGGESVHRLRTGYEQAVNRFLRGNRRLCRIIWLMRRRFFLCRITLQRCFFPSRSL